MKRIFLTLFSTALIALLGLPAVAATSSPPTLSVIPADELASVTGGLCGSRCDDEEEEEEEEDLYVVGYEWLQTRQVDEEAEKLSYGIATEVSNVSGTRPKNYTLTFSDNCRYQWTSGGVGIKAGFDVSIGRTYYCPISITLSGTIDPGFRVKIYRADMRQVSRVTVSQFRIFSDGSSERTGKSDTGRLVNYYSRYHPVATR